MSQQRDQGFTLIEILVVVLIIGLLATILASNLIGRADDAKISLARTQIKQLEQQLEMYKLDNGRYPTDDQGLKALVRAPASDPQPKRYPPGGYVKADAITDPWDTRYQYRTPGQHNAHSFDLFSFGPDSQEGGEGEFSDIGNWSTSEL